jgi:hypothetical protein
VQVLQLLILDTEKLGALRDEAATREEKKKQEGKKSQEGRNRMMADFNDMALLLGERVGCIETSQNTTPKPAPTIPAAKGKVEAAAKRELSSPVLTAPAKSRKTTASSDRTPISPLAKQSTTTSTTTMSRIMEPHNKTRHVIDLEEEGPTNGQRDYVADVVNLLFNTSEGLTDVRSMSPDSLLDNKTGKDLTFEHSDFPKFTLNLLEIGQLVQICAVRTAANILQRFFEMDYLTGSKKPSELQEEPVVERDPAWQIQKGSGEWDLLVRYGIVEKFNLDIVLPSTFLSRLMQIVGVDFEDKKAGIVHMRKFHQDTLNTIHAILRYRWSNYYHAVEGSAWIIDHKVVEKKMGYIINDGKYRLKHGKAIMVEHVFFHAGNRKVVRMLKALRNPNAERRGRVLDDQIEEDHPTLGDDADTEAEDDFLFSNNIDLDIWENGNN